MLLDDRFQVLDATAAGGMGTVFRGVDHASGEQVAIKILQRLSEEGVARFRREVAVLAELIDPCIVTYVGHGTTPDQRPYLVMEWLEGEDLETRLGRGPLSIDDATTVSERIARGLAVAHVRGVVHRDVKPSNVVLVRGRVEEAKLVDFGIARRVGAPRATGTGHVIGTPGFMAPEQVRGEAEIDARADVFALGCLLFEAISGRAAFAGEGPMAVLAKVLLEEPPRLATLCAVPRQLDEVVARMLAKDPAGRPADAAAVLHALRSTISLAPPSPVAGGEQSVVTLVAAAPIAGAVADTWRDDRTVRMPALSLEGRVERLVDGTTLHVFTGSGLATDQAVRAAHCAIDARRAAPGTPVAIATGRAVVASGRVPMGELVDRVASLLASRSDAVVLDDLTAGLLDVRFDIDRGSTPARLGAERSGVAPRRLLGRVSPCVGRDRDLRILTDSWDEARDEESRRVVVVLAPAGTGKSRLAHELVARLEDGAPRPTIITAAGDALATTVPLGAIADLVRSAAGIDRGAPPALARAKLHDRVAGVVPAAAVDETERALAAVVALRDDGSGPRSGSGVDPALSGEDIRRSIATWLRAEAAAAGLVLVVDDAHWLDDASLDALDAVIGQLRDVPCLVLALARPTLAERHPDPFAEHGALLLRLGPLGRRACESLADQVLGAVAPEVRSRIVALSEGNAFFLEELIRAAADDDAPAFPETVVAVLDARLAALDEVSRRVARAASILGASFSREALAAMTPEVADRVDGVVDDLVRRELLEVSGPRGDQLAFRHALLREAAHRTLTADDRRIGHEAAARWLAGRREPTAGIVAAHFEQAGVRDEAARWYRRAAVDAYRLDDRSAIVASADAAIRCGAGSEDVVYLRSMQSIVAWWSGDAAASVRWGREALALAPRGSNGWLQAVASMMAASMQLHPEPSDPESDEWRGVVEWLQRNEPPPGSEARFVRAASIVGTEVLHLGRLADGTALIDRVLATLDDADPVARPLREQLRGWSAFVRGDAAAARRLALASAAGFDALGMVRDPDWSRCIARLASVQLGLVDDATPAGPARQHPASSLFEAGSLFPRALAALVRGDHALAETLAERCCAITRGGGRVPLVQGLSILARALLARGDVAGAARAAEEAAVLARPLRLHASVTLGVVATVRRAQGDVVAATRAIDQALVVLADVGGTFEGELALRLVEAEVRRAAGDRAALATALAAAREVVRRTARSIDHPGVLAVYLQSPHVRALEALERAG